MATSSQHEISFPAGLGWIAAIVVLTYAASQFFHWSAGWQVLILTGAALLAFVMFLVLTLRRT